MATTDEMMLMTPIVRPRYGCIGGGSEYPVWACDIFINTKVITNVNIPKTKRTQALIVAKALNIPGILPLLEFSYASW